MTVYLGIQALLALSVAWCAAILSFDVDDRKARNQLRRFATYALVMGVWSMLLLLR